jgi:hypothetical protein
VEASTGLVLVLLPRKPRWSWEWQFVEGIYNLRGVPNDGGRSDHVLFTFTKFHLSQKWK